MKSGEMRWVGNVAGMGAISNLQTLSGGKLEEIYFGYQGVYKIIILKCILLK
jgi:hypothetical protein